ncbi:MAG: hypothetical protein HC913_02740 [Microscillaceae bacterium]|nr:hypothetical protein [Microscillaceae bacterium]
MKTYVLYHAQCPDGFGAAWAIWKKMGNKPEYIPVNHHQPPPALAARSTVYLVDFCYPLAITQQLAAQAQKMLILDHHQSAEADLQKLDRAAFPHVEVHFDMQKSGAVLAWEYFHQCPAPEFCNISRTKTFGNSNFLCQKSFRRLCVAMK